jgi:hypothetical protein
MVGSLGFIILAAFLTSTLVFVSVHMARVERRRIKVFDDVVGHVGLPIAFLSPMIPMPRVAGYIVTGVGCVIFMVAGARRLTRRRTDPADPRVDGPPDRR